MFSFHIPSMFSSYRFLVFSSYSIQVFLVQVSGVLFSYSIYVFQSPVSGVLFIFLPSIHVTSFWVFSFHIPFKYSCSSFWRSLFIVHPGVLCLTPFLHGKCIPLILCPHSLSPLLLREKLIEHSRNSQSHGGTIRTGIH